MKLLEKNMQLNRFPLLSGLLTITRQATLFCLAAGVAIGAPSNADAGLIVIPLKDTASCHSTVPVYRTVKVPCTTKRLVLDECGYWKLVTITTWKTVRVLVEYTSSGHR
jgi:hypothetical protein